MGVKGIDGMHALLKKDRADLSVKRKNLIADKMEAIEASMFANARPQLFAEVPNYAYN